MASYSMDIEMFISEVKKYPEIWNNNSEDSRSPIRRFQAWTEIARLFIDDFDELSELEKNDVYKKLQGKWRNIRDSFVRHKRRNYAVRKKGYIYAKHLTFLEDIYKTSQSGSDNEAQNEGDETWSDGDEEAKLKKMLFKSGFETKEEPLVDWPETRKRKKAKKQDTQIDFVETSFPEASCSYENEDEDKSFFLSLIPAVRDFDVDKKLEFRSQVLKLVKKYRQEIRRRPTVEVHSDGSRDDS